MRLLNNFPWRIFLRIFIVQVLLFNVLFISVISISEVHHNLGTQIFNELTYMFFVSSLFISALAAYRFSRPLQKAIQKAIRIASKKASQEPNEADDSYLDEELGEFSELEIALNRIARKLKKKKDQLVREREENQAFMSSVEEGLMSVNLDEKLLYFNSQFAAQFIEPADLQNSAGPISMKTIFRSPEVSDAFQAALREGKNRKLTTKLATKIDHQERFFAISIAPLRKTKSRDIYGAIGIFHDITELKKAEQIRIEFVGNASHELRTPLTSIKGYVETLKGDFESGEMAQAGTFLNIISRNVDRLIELVNDLLSISALDAHSELRMEMVNPLQISEQVVSELEVIASEKNQVIRVIGNVADFWADARKVEQVLRNLVSNAVKYIPHSGSIQIRWESNPLNDVVLRVIDDGPGIPTEHHSRLFERFYRVDKGRTRDAGGTGLGLAIVKHIMQNHGGHIQLVSEIGKGSEFICTFPRRQRKS